MEKYKRITANELIRDSGRHRNQQVEQPHKRRLIPIGGAGRGVGHALLRPSVTVLLTNVQNVHVDKDPVVERSTPPPKGRIRRKPHYIYMKLGTGGLNHNLKEHSRSCLCSMAMPLCLKMCSKV